MENRFERFAARDVQFVDNSVHHTPSASSLARQGLAALHQYRYEEAIRRLQDAVAADATVQEVHFHLALALLRGTRPHRQRREVLAAVRGCIAAAVDLPEARALAALVAEDSGLSWRRTPRPPAIAARLVVDVPAHSAVLLLRHTQAGGAPVYEALRAQWSGDAS